MRNRLLLIAALFAALLASGCTTTQTVTRDLNRDIATVEASRVQAEAARYEAIASIGASSPDSSVKTAAVMALALAGRSGGATEAPRWVQPVEPKSPLEAGFSLALAVADRALQVYGLRVNSQVALRQSEMSRDVSIASYGAITGVATASYTSLSDIASRIQAPQANVSTVTNTTTSNVATNTTTSTANTTTTNNTNTTTNSGNRNCVGGNSSSGTNTGTTTPTGGGSGPGGTASC